MNRGPRLRTGTKLADAGTPGRVLIVRRVFPTEVAAQVSGQDHLGRIWISKANINVTADTSNASRWSVAA